MKLFSKVVHDLSDALSWVSMAILVCMALLITAAVLLRLVGFPILGDIEIVKLMMIVLIMCALAHTQKAKHHISVGILVDHFSPRYQALFDLIAYTMMLIFSWMISAFVLYRLLTNRFAFVTGSELLEIPYWPFKVIVIVGLFCWGLEAIVSFADAVKRLTAPAGSANIEEVKS